MKKIPTPAISARCMLCCLLALSALAACHKDDDEQERAKRTVIIYMAAENSLAIYAESDIREMMAGVSQINDNEHLVIYVDDASMPRIYVLDNGNAVTSYSSLEPKYTFPGERNSADAATLDFVMQYAYSRYPADTYGLVLWSHATGWTPGHDDASARQRIARRKSFGVDNGDNSYSNRGSHMNIADMASVLSQYDDIEYIMFDACLMQNIEVAYELRNCAQYIIGSPAEIPASGAPYNNIISNLFAQPFSPEALIYNYYNFYNSIYNYGVVMSAIKTDQFDEFAETTKTLIANHTLTDADYSGCLNYYLYEWNALPYVLAPLPDFYDMKGVMQQVLTDDEMSLWLAALNKLVVTYKASDYWFTAFSDDGRGQLMNVDQAQCCGVSMYVPLEKYTSDIFYNDYQTTQWGQLFNIK